MGKLKLLIVIFSIFSIELFSQTTCTTSAAFCSGNTGGTTFPAGVCNGSAAAGPDYGCLFTTPNPAWYYFQVSQNGTIIIDIAGTGGNDVDFICWGPFTSPNANCGNLTAANTVDCSYSASASETVTINGAITGQYYQLLITNFSNLPQSINFNQTSGSGSTNCNLVIPVTSATVCAGQPATIFANTTLTNPTFSWSPGGLTTQTIVVSPTVTTVYTVTVNGLNPASTPTTLTNTGTVTIISSPTVAITPSVSSICLGQSQTLVASGSGPFIWTASSGSNPAASGTVTVTPAATTNYSVLVGTGSCTASAVATVSITSSPTAAITPSLSTICLGQSQALSVSGGGPYVWTASSGSNPAAVANVTVTPTTTTTYTVLSGTGSCTSTAVATVSISTTPVIAITPSISSICIGQSQALSVSGSGPFTWTASSGTNPPSVGNVTVTPTTTTTYTVLSGSGTCTASAVATVSISLSPSITITPSLSILCLGQNQILNSNAVGPFIWTASTGVNPPATANVTVSPTSTTTYTLVSGVGTCTSSAVATVSVTPALTINITPTNTIICNGQFATLSVNGSSGPFVWTASSGANPLGTGTVSLNPTISTSYTVIAGTGACTATANSSITVLPNISTVITAISPSVCLTNTVLISAPLFPGLTYTWLPTASILGTTNSNSIAALPQTSTTVIYTVNISNGVCAQSNTVQLAVNTAPNITNFTTLNNDTICVGGCVTFSANVTGSSPILFQWFYESGIGTSSVGIAPEACYPSAGNFSVAATASNTCGFDTLVKSNFVTVYDMPVLIVNGDTTINIGTSAQVYASGGITYNWTPNLNGTIACPTCSTTIVSPTLTTNYIVVASNSPYCRVQDTVKVIVDINCGDFFIPNVFSPNGDGLNDDINVHGRCISTFNLQIFSRWGEKVFETSSTSESWDGTFRGKKMDTGVFVYKADGISIDGQSFKFKGNITLIR